MIIFFSIETEIDDIFIIIHILKTYPSVNIERNEILSDPSTTK